jgi:hypothetical protein
MAHHRDHHPVPQPDCFGCRTLSVGFQGLQSRQGVDPVQHVPVVADDGARAGRTVGRTDEHWDGRRDATVYAPKLTIETKARET